MLSTADTSGGRVELIRAVALPDSIDHLVSGTDVAPMEKRPIKPPATGAHFDSYLLSGLKDC